MAIVFERAYKASDGKCYATLEQAQEIELEALLGDPIPCQKIVENKAEILNILTLTDASRPKARGVPKKRKPKSEAQAELPKVA